MGCPILTRDLKFLVLPPILFEVDTSFSILQFAKRFFAGTLLSRVSGLIRDIAMAFCFGATAEIAAFMVAYRLANLFRRLLGEGNLQAGFVPQFETLRGENFEEGVRFYRDTASSLTAICALVVLASELFLWAISPLLSPAWREIATLAMWMVPGLLFICLSGLNSALLQSQKKYFWPAAAPIAFNAVWIGAAFITRDVKYLALGIAIAYAAQWAMTALQTRRELAPVPRQPLRFFSPETRKLIRPMSLGILGVGAVQINSALDAIFARIADLSGPVYLWYAIRIEQLPLALFGIALSGALLPPLARAMRQGETETFRALLETGLRHSAALMIPCTFGLIALGGVGINLLYGHGDFTPAAVQKTLVCLWAYGAGLVPSVFVLLLAQGFYAQKSYWIPARASLISVALNIALNTLFVFAFGWGAVSIALATSLSALANCLLLSQTLNPSLLRHCLRLSAACAPPAALALAVEYFGFESLAVDLIGQAIQFLILAAIYIGGTIGISLFLRIEEVRDLFKRRLPS